MNIEVIENKRPGEWGIIAVIIFVVIMILFDYYGKWPSMSIYIIVEKIFIPSGIYNDELYLLIASLFYQIMAVLSVFIIVAKIHRNKFLQSLRIQKLPLKTIGLYALLTSGIYMAVGISALILRYLLYHTYIYDLFFSPSVNNSVTGCHISTWIIGLIPALTASLSEEIVYRGYIFSGLRKKLGDIVSIIIVTVLFIYVHVEQIGFSPIHLYSLSIGAIILGIIRVKTDSLSKCILLHFFFNLFFYIHKIIYLCWMTKS